MSVYNKPNNILFMQLPTTNTSIILSYCNHEDLSLLKLNIFEETI